jgi:tetratricopeptide (TPR) repeat protein
LHCDRRFSCVEVNSRLLGLSPPQLHWCAGSTEFRGHVQQGDTLVSQSLYAAAAAAYGQAIAMDATQPYVYTKRATAFAANGQTKQALADYSKALEMKPDVVSTLVNRGKLHLQMCHLGDAKEDFAAALAARPGHAEAASAAGQADQVSVSLKRAQVRGDAFAPKTAHAASA